MGVEFLNTEENVVKHGPSVLVFMRHAQTVRNVAKGRSPQFHDIKSLKRVKGIPTSEEPLSSVGKRQAGKAGDILKQKYGTFDFIYHPGYLYTQQTVDEVLLAFENKPEVHVEFLLRKRDQGFVYDMLDKEIERSFPWLRQYWQTFDLFFGQAPGSERLIEIADRVRYFLDSLFRDNQLSSVLVVTHASTLLATRFLVEGLNYQAANNISDVQRPGNCGIVSYGEPGSEKGLTIGKEKPVFIDLGHY